MSNNEIVTSILEDGSLYGICKNITKQDQLTDDLFQEVVLILLEYNNEKLNDSYNRKWLKYLTITIIKNQFNSKTSPFYKKYKKFNYELRDQNYELSTIDAYNEETSNTAIYDSITKINRDKELSDRIFINIDRIEEILEDVYWYDKIIFQIYFKLGEYNKTDGPKRDLECKKEKSTLRRIEEMTGIDHNSVGYTINNTIKYIQKELEKR